VKQVDIADRDNDPTPPSFTTNWSHGTHASGLIAAETNNDLGVASIGNRISLMAIKATKDADNPADLYYALEGIVWAAQNGANVISMSFGTAYRTQTMQDVVNFAYNKGCLLVASAGNDGKDEPNYPAALDHVIAVGSCNGDDKKSYFSNYGTWLDLLSPGGMAINSSFGILSTSTIATSNVASYGVGGGYETKLGTSMAAPIVSGLCGLMLSANPSLTPEKLTTILKNTCDDIYGLNPTYVSKLGAGRINAAKAVQAAMSSRSSLTANFASSATTIGSGATIRFADLTDGDPVSWSWQFAGGTPVTSTEQNPEITYEYGGTYSVTLKVTDRDGNTSTETKTNFIIVKGGGKTEWIEQHTNFSTPLRGVLHTDIVNQDVVWILTFDGLDTGVNESTTDFALTTDGGDTWQPGIIDIEGIYSPECVSAVSATTAWVAAFNSVGDGGGIFKTTDGGATWMQQTTAAFNSTGSFVNIIKMFNEQEGFCQGDPVDGEFEIYATTDGGTTWQRVRNTPPALSGETGWTGLVTAAGENTAWFGTSKGRVFKTTDKGQTWQAYTTGAVEVNSLSFSDEQPGVLLCGSPGSWKMLRTADGGATWQEVAIASEYVDCIAAVPGCPHMWVALKINATTYHELFSAYTLDNGTTWTIIDNGVQYTNLCMYDRNNGWAGGFNLDETGGGIYKWPLSQTSAAIPPIEREQPATIRIYPNPVCDVLYLENGEDAAYEILDLLGRNIISGEYVSGIAVNSLPKGPYLIRIKKMNGEIETKKFMKK
jgi:PKD repeat protein